MTLPAGSVEREDHVMTVITDPGAGEGGNALARTPGRTRLLAIGVLLAVLAAALGVWLVATPETGSADTDEIEALLEDYANTWRESDANAFRGVVTEDFQLRTTIYQLVGSRAYGQDTHADVEGLAGEIGLGNAFGVERTTELVVSGEGPWFVSVGENWIGPVEFYEGTASYSIVEEDGELKIGYHYWAGLLSLGD
jgi:hypothetical protein